VFTRNGLDWTKRFSVIAGTLDISGQAILDGEVVVIHEGRTNFSELQAELAAGKQDRLVYYAFDLLWRDGDLRKLPQVERKRMLSYLLGENDIGLPVIYSEHLTGDGQEMFEHAAKLNFEGIVSKNAQAPYRSDRNEGWLKIKTVQREDSRSSASSKIPPEWPRYTSESAREKISSTWARSGPAGREPSRARSENSLIPSSVRNQS
jgi:bifunctional non-homologous end joining protein LigD